jgi:ubiquinone/menaquinone biosynthesis C-methylase UbiE
MNGSETSPRPWDFVTLTDPAFNEEDYFKTHEQKYRLMQKHIAGIPGIKRILDVGVGSGIFYSVFPNPEDYHLEGVDIVTDYKAILERRGITTTIADINTQTLPHPDGSFDLVLCDSLLEHSLNPKHLMHELFRVLKPEGSFMIAVPQAMSLRMRWNYLRGRNPFWPLIDNLFSKDFLQRCSIFYSLKDLLRVLPKDTEILSTVYYDETHHDHANLSMSILRLFTSIVPSLRDGILITGRKLRSSS